MSEHKTTSPRLKNYYGFDWGPAQIVRACTHGTDRVLLIETSKQRLQVRITKTGLLRLDEGGPVSKIAARRFS